MLTKARCNGLLLGGGGGRAADAAGTPNNNRRGGLNTALNASCTEVIGILIVDENPRKIERRQVEPRK